MTLWQAITKFFTVGLVSLFSLKKLTEPSNFTSRLALSKCLFLVAHTDPCLANIPDALSFKEALCDQILSKDIVILSGSHNIDRATSDFGKFSADHLRRFADFHGYTLVFLHELDYDKSMYYKGVQFSNHWHKPFAFPVLRKNYPDAKYFVWLDDDVLVPYPETDMLNHYVNAMQADQSVHILVGEDIQSQVLNAGMYFMKNSPFSFWIMEEIKEIGLEQKGHWATNYHHEQSCMVEVRKRHSLENHIRVISHRQGRYNFNTFVDKSEILAKVGDAFVHYVSMPQGKLDRMKAFMKEVAQWRASVPDSCNYPYQI